MSEISWPFRYDVSSYVSTCPECGQQIVRQDWVLRQEPAKFIHYACWESAERSSLSPLPLEES
jgi:predicted RNA-binding Zn-ribbon protein involved in translation (DUF1610 family)